MKRSSGRRSSRAARLRRSAAVEVFALRRSGSADIKRRHAWTHELRTHRTHWTQARRERLAPIAYR